MKLQKVKKALTHKTIRIVTDADGYQWVGDYHAMYLADKALDITEGNIKAILDIDEDQRDKWTVFADSGRERPWFDQCPIELADEPLRAIVSVSWMGELVTVFSTQDGEAAMIPQTLITPADGKAMPVDPDRVFYWQSAAGQNKIVTPRGEIVSAHLDGPSEACTGQGYISHWATCPQAEAFRG